MSIRESAVATSQGKTVPARMSVHIVKQLEKAKRYVEKGRIDDAIEAYQSVLSAVPNHLESIQSLGDLLTMQKRPDRAAVYYGMLFDRLTAPREEPKAVALYVRFLKPHQQPPERVARFAVLLQKQNRAEEAIQKFASAALAYELSGKGEDALACFVRIAQLDPENRDRHIAVAELAERLGNSAAASRGYLRAGQLTTQNDDEALVYFGKAHQLMPNDRSVSLLYAQTLMRKGDPAAAAALLSPLSETEKDAPFLETYAEALTRSGQLEAARTVLDGMSNLGTGSAGKVFLLATEVLRGGKDDQAADLLAATKKSMLAARRESEFGSAVDHLVEEFPKSLRLVQFWVSFYGEINRETKYFEALGRLFDLNVANNQFPGACEAFERLVEIDPYDSRNQERMDLLKGRVGDEFLSRVKSRVCNAASHHADAPAIEHRRGKSLPSNVLLEEVQSGQTLEDLLVQAEIFVQYSLQSKAVERLQRIVELFPAEPENNERLRSLFEAARWWPKEGAAPRRPAEKSRPA